MLRVVSIIYTINDKCLAYRVAYYTQHLCRIYTPSFPGVTHREAIVYISVWIIISGQKIEDRVYVERHKYKTIFSFRASFFGSGIKKAPGLLRGPGRSPRYGRL